MQISVYSDTSVLGDFPSNQYRQKKSPASFLKPGLESQAVLGLFIIPIPGLVASCACSTSFNFAAMRQFFVAQKNVKTRFFLYQSLCDHSLCDFDKSGDVCTCNVVTFCGVLLCIVVSIVVDVCHDALQVAVNFFECP